MARCGCSSECLCTVVGGDCMSVSGNGSFGSPYTVDAVLDPSAQNALVCNPEGLYVQTPNYEDTACIEVSGTGTVLDPLLISPVIDPDLDNILQCGLAGLFVNRNAFENTISVGNTDCIQLSGDGSPGDPVLADPVIASVSGNILICSSAGLVAGGADFETWVTALSTAANVAQINAASVTYLATL